MIWLSTGSWDGENLLDYPERSYMWSLISLKREAKGDFTCTEEGKIEEEKAVWSWIRHWKEEATTERMLAATKSWEREGMNFIPWSPKRECNTLTSWFWPSDINFRLLTWRTVREYSPVVLSQQVCGDLLKQSFVKTNTLINLINLIIGSTFDFSLYPWT